MKIFPVYILLFLIVAIALILNHEGFALILAENLFWILLIGVGAYLLLVKRNINK